MSGPGHRHRMGAIVLVMWALVVSLTCLGIPDGGRADAAEKPEVRVDIDSIAPAFLTPGDRVTISGTVHNVGSTTVTDGEINVTFDSTRFTHRSDLDPWLAADPDDKDWSVAAESIEGSLRAGHERSFSVSFDADRLGLSTKERTFGPYGITVRFDTRTEAVGWTRTFLVWIPSAAVRTGTVAVLAPLVDFAPPDPATPTVQDSTRALQVVEATGDLGVDWILDPALAQALPGEVDAADDEAGATQSPTPAPTAASTPSTASIAPAVVRRLSDRDVFLLPYMDTDLAALAHAERSDLLADAERVGRTVLDPTIAETARSGLYWPKDGNLDQRTADMLAAQGEASVVLVSEENLPLVKETSVTPDALTTIPTADGGPGTLRALVPDKALSSLFQDYAPDDPAWDQRLLAETALLSVGRPADPPRVLIALPRDWSPDPAQVQDVMSTLAGTPWITLGHTSDLVAGDPDPRARVPLPEETEEDTGARKLAARIGQASDSLDDYALITPDPSQLVDDYSPGLLAPLALPWWQDPDGRLTAADSAIAEVQALTESILVIPGSSVNLIAEAGAIPIGVANRASYPVTVVVHLYSHDPKLVTDTDIQEVVPAKREVQVRVPVKAVANGDVLLDIQLLNSAGHTVAEAQTLEVRVRADWENLGTWTMGGLFAFAFVFGLIRTIHRRRRERAEAQ